MIHLPELIQDLSFILITAAVVTLLFKYLKQPVVLGYLIAGFLVGPHFGWTPKINDTQSISVWAEIGVIFLLFGLGLEFSFKKLAKVGASASITAVFEVAFMLTAGYLTGKFLGWSNMDSVFLGGILSISSTTIIVRAFEELGLKGRNFVSLVFGVLIVEDMVAILLLVLLSALAVTQTLSGTELLASSLKLGFFLALWFLVGIYVIPTFLNRIRNLLNDETTLVVSIGLCLMMVIIATKVGFSPALGAFVMGSVLAETREAKRIEHLLLPVKNLFAAVFFVSVGMMINPNVLREHFGTVLLLTVVTLVGKFLSSSLGALLSGRSLKNSIQAGMSLAQIGEFSFIIATLGLTLKVTSDFLYPIAVAVSAITTFTTPYLIQRADRFYHAVERGLPVSFLQRLMRYESATSYGFGHSIVGVIWQEYGLKVLLNSVLVIAIGLGFSKIVLPLGIERFGDPLWVSVLCCVLALFFAIPFLWAIIMGPLSGGKTYDFAKIERLQRMQLGISVIRVSVGIFLMSFVIGQFVSIQAIYGLLILFVSMIVLFFSKYAEPLYRTFEERFVLNLNDKERELAARTVKTPTLTPWQATLAEFTVSAHSDLIGRSLADCQLKEKYGLTVAMIRRGNRNLLTPGKHDLLMPYDRLYLIGTDDQLAQSRKSIELESSPEDENLALPEVFGMDSFLLNASHSDFVGRPIRECGLRELVHGLIVGIERGDQRILSPDSSLKLLVGDLVWVVGDRSKIMALKKTA